VIQKISLDSGESADARARLAVITSNLVSAPACIDETDSTVRIVSNAIVLDIGCVQPLLRDAVAIEDDPVAILESELGGIR
jgi:hypothetical protein